MIENFLRHLSGPAEVGADVFRGLGALSVVLAAVFFDLNDAAIVAFALPGLFFPRFIGMKPWVDMAFAATLLVASWSNVFDLYTSINGWDLLIHFACTGVLAAGMYLLLAQLRIVPPPHAGGFTRATGIVLTTSFGLALSALWEMVEWLGSAYVSDEIYTAYDDTIADTAVGGFGAVAAGFAIAFLPMLRMNPPAPSGVPPLPQ